MRIKTTIKETNAIAAMFMDKWIRSAQFGRPFDEDEIPAIEEEMYVYVQEYFRGLGDKSEVYDDMLDAYLAKVDFGGLAETYWEETPSFAD